MKTLYSDQPPLTKPEKSIFLVGPTPRSDAVPSWRPNAVEILEKLGFDGTVLIPERKDWKTKFGYTDQIEWEYACLTHATAIAAWVPRCMTNMPALTTNVEFGYWLATSPKRIFYGRPDKAPHTSYLDWLYRKHLAETASASIFDSLEELLKGVVIAIEMNLIHEQVKSGEIKIEIGKVQCQS
jgi:hypothetical protein